MKLRALVIFLATFCFFVTSPAWAATSICDNTPGNLVTNCGFESGSFSGWTRGGNLGFTGVTSSAPYVNSGNFGGQLGPVGSDGTLSQFIWGNTWTFVFRQDPAYFGLDDFVITFAGSCGPGCGRYNGSFYLYNDGGTPNDFTVLLNGVDVGPGLVDAGGFPYTQYVGTGFVGGTPEPSSLVLLGTGVLGLAGAIRRKFRM